MAQTLTIGQIAKAAGVAARTIRYYEGISVLPAPSRTASGYRQYDGVAATRSPGALGHAEWRVTPGYPSSPARAGARPSLCGAAPDRGAPTAPAGT
jgi:MerR family regulatory protein